MGYRYRSARRTAKRGSGVLASVAALALALSACGLGDDVAGGQANPCDLLTTSEIQAAVGQGVAEGVRSQNTCNWATDGGGVFTTGIVKGGDELFESAVRTDGNVRVSGVGEKASFFGRGEFAFMQVLQGSVNLRLDYSGPSAPGESGMTSLAQAATPRL